MPIQSKEDCFTEVKVKKDLTGFSFEGLTVLALAGKGKNHIFWLCECKICGKRKNIRQGSLASNKSCGCKVTSSATKHGLFDKENRAHNLYPIYNAMMQRCFNPKRKYWKAYGGRGISVCKEWVASFQQFTVDMGARPKGYQIDRIDNDKGYSKDNCRWSTPKENSNNRKRENQFTVADTKKG